MNQLAVQEDLLHWLESYCEKNNFFIVDFYIQKQKICLNIDNDRGISMQECAVVHKALQMHLIDLIDDISDFSIQVSSPGIMACFKKTRQYQKNIGKTLIVNTLYDSPLEGKLLKVNDDTIEIDCLNKENKLTIIPFAEIKNCRLKLNLI